MPVCPSCGHDVPDDARFCGACGHQASEISERTGLVGTTVAERYRVLRVIAEGGMGIVYEAEQSMGEGTRRVAIKTLLPELSRDPVVVSRFNRECSVVASLEHPNTVRVYDFGTTDDGTLYIAMEYVAGRPLGEVIAQGPMPIERCLGIVEQIASALEEAHDQGIVHRDLKPDNIVLCERAGLHDFVKVLDFGIAKRSSTGGRHDTNLTQQGMILGTPPYMSPEQFTGESLDRTSDVYSLGIILYEMLNSRLPFEGDTPWQWAHQHMSVEPAPFSVVVPHELSAVVRQALSKSREARPQSALDFFRRLSAAAQAHSTAPAVSHPSESPRTALGAVAAGAQIRTEPSMLKVHSAEPKTLDDGPDASLAMGTTAPAELAVSIPSHIATGTDPAGPRVDAGSRSIGVPWGSRAYVPPPTAQRGRSSRGARRRWPWVFASLVALGLAAISTAAYWNSQIDEPARPPLPDAGAEATLVAAESPQQREDTSTAIPSTHATAAQHHSAPAVAKPPSNLPAPETNASATTTNPRPSSSGTPFPLPFPITLPSVLPPGFPPLTLPLPGAASSATPSTSPQGQSPAAAGAQQCTQASVLADTDLEAAVSQYQACEAAVGKTASMPARAKIASVGIAKATALARQGRCDEANRVVQTLARIGVHRNAQIAVTGAGCKG